MIKYGYSETEEALMELNRQPLSLLPPILNESLEDEVKVDVTIQKNRDLWFRVFAPHAQKVEATLAVSGKVRPQILLNQTGESCFEGILPYREQYAGAQPLELLIDNVNTLTSSLPIGWCRNRPVNFIEVPEEDASYAQMQEVPHGIVSALPFYSKVLDQNLRCLVYLPADYFQSEKSFPVLYLLHGGTENEWAWVNTYRVADIADNLLAHGKANPCIIVMPNGMIRFQNRKDAVWDGALEQVLIQDLIPLIERQFRVKTDKRDRAVAGLSMGAYMSNDIGLGHPELFGSIGQFTGCMYHETDFPDYIRPYQKILNGSEDSAKKTAENFQLFFRSTTREEDHFDYFLRDDQICAKLGFEDHPGYVRTVYSGHTSKCRSWRLGIFDFLQLVFKDECDG